LLKENFLPKWRTAVQGKGGTRAKNKKAREKTDDRRYNTCKERREKQTE
jgi:hypothetical protein